MQLGNGQMLFGDCLDVMATIPDGSVDMVLCDLPYGTTRNKWDAIIPFEPLWAHYWRVCKPNAAIVLTAAQPFTSALVTSQIENFRYDWVWRKEKGTGHLNAKKMPLKDKEDVLVFGKQSSRYFPQKTTGHRPYTAAGTGAYRKVNTAKSENYNYYNPSSTDNDGSRYPKQVLEFQTERKNTHPTQKPVALFEYLIRTYTRPGELVLDNCSGSGTTAIPAQQSDRRSICIENDVDYYFRSVERVAAACS